jgi:hypothetical protein
MHGYLGMKEYSIQYVLKYSNICHCDSNIVVI